MDEPYVNVRKIKQPTAIARKQQLKKNLESGEVAVDENVDAVWACGKPAFTLSA